VRVHYDQTVRQRAAHEEEEKVNVHGYTMSRQSDNTRPHPYFPGFAQPSPQLTMPTCDTAPSLGLTVMSGPPLSPWLEGHANHARHVTSLWDVNLANRSRRSFGPRRLPTSRWTGDEWPGQGGGCGECVRRVHW